MMPAGLHELRLTSDERSALERMCPYFPAHHLDFLSSIKLSPKEQVKLEFIPKAGDKGEIGCLIEGLWRETILYEVPLLAICRCSGAHIVKLMLCSQ